MKIGVFITSYNRPEYLLQCLHSIDRSITGMNDIFIFDDCSTNDKVFEIISRFNISNLFKNNDNKGINKQIKNGFETLFGFGYDIVMNIDSDAIVSQNYLNRLIKLKQQHKGYIISGYNSIKKNKNGELENKIIFKGNDYLIKKSCNGINMVANRLEYETIIKPALSIKGNWDFNTSIYANGFIISSPSVIQHIGEISTLGHNMYDKSSDFISKAIHIPDVTLFGVDCNDTNGIIRASDICQKHIQFGDVKIITKKLFNGREGYSHFCIKKMADYINTSHVLIIHTDGYIQNHFAWDNKWLQYDYIGATWGYKDNMNVGNGGFSLRSKKLLSILKDLDLKQYHPEDDIICRYLRPTLEIKYGIKFAPEEVANDFSIEAYGSNVFTDSLGVKGNRYMGQFGFHGYGVENLITPILKK